MTASPTASNDRQKLAIELLQSLKVVRIGRRLGFQNVAHLAEGGLEANGAAAPRGSNRRRHKRFPNPVMTVTFDLRKYATGDWSEGGVRLIGFDRQVKIGTKHQIKITMKGLEALAEVRVIRAPRSTGHLALEFTRLSK